MRQQLTDLSHGPVSFISFRKSLDNQAQQILSNVSSSVVERIYANDEGSSLKIFCEVDGPKPQSLSALNSSPLSISVTLRENERPRWWKGELIENAIHSALIPALITPSTGWSGTFFDVSFVIELPPSFNASQDENGSQNLHDELYYLHLISQCVNAGSLAIMSRGIPMRDFVVGCICALVEDSIGGLKINVDPATAEKCVVVVGATVMPSLGQFTALWWHTSHGSTATKSSYANFQGEILDCLLVTSEALRPLLASSVSSAQ